MKKKEEKPLVSVIMRAYNTGEYIEESIQSVLNQTYDKLEIIIYNDGSTDNTEEIVREYEKKDKRIKLISNKINEGLVKGMNESIKVSTGDYIAILDSDDVAYPNWIERTLSYLLNDRDLLMCGSLMTRYYEKNGKWYEEPMYVPTEYEEIKRHMMVSNCFFNSTLIDKKVFTEYNLKYEEEYKYAEDYKMWIDIMKIGKVCNIPEFLAKYRKNLNSVSHRLKKEQDRDAYRIQLEYINEVFLRNFNINIKIDENIEIGDCLQLYRKIYNDKYKLNKIDKNIINNIAENIIFSMYFRKNFSLKISKILFEKSIPIKNKIKFIRRYLRKDKYIKNGKIEKIYNI